MLPLIPPTTLNDLAGELSTFSRRSSEPIPADSPAGSRFRSLLTTNPVRAIIQRAHAWLIERDERRYGTRIVSRPPHRHPNREPVAFTRRAPVGLRDQDLAA